MTEDWSEKIGGLRSASLNVSGYFADTSDYSAVFGPNPGPVPVVAMAADGCVIMRGTLGTEAAIFDADGAITYSGTPEYSGLLANGKHIHTLPWYRRKRFQRIKARWSSFRLRLGSWIAGRDLNEEDDW